MNNTMLGFLASAEPNGGYSLERAESADTISNGSRASSNSSRAQFSPVKTRFPKHAALPGDDALDKVSLYGNMKFCLHVTNPSTV